MTWRFDDLLTFLKVVEAGGVTAAATELNVSKSVVSKRISDLEDALGAQLLRRSTRAVTPTEQGWAFYERTREALRELDEAVDSVADRQGGLGGRLRVTAPMSFGTLYLGRILADFARLHPKLELSLDLDDRMLDLVGGGYDLAVRIGRLHDSTLMARKLCVSRRVVCCSPAYARHRGLPQSIEELSGHDCIDYANVHASRLWQFLPSSSGGKPAAAMTRSRFIANNGEAMRDAALAGLGLCVLPLFIVADDLRSGRLIHVLPNEQPVPDTIYTVYAPTRHLPRRVRTLIDHLIAALGHPPPWEAAPHGDS
jgi:DNA-binding transcriptional LysR family regulator